MTKTIAERAASVTRAPIRIIEAALEEFAEHGIDGARVDQIVKRAGVSKQLFYYYFESKDEVYKLVLEDAAEHAINLILGQDYNQPIAEDAVRHFFTIIFDQYMDMPFLIKFTVDQDYHNGAHISGRNKLRSLLPVLVDRLCAIIARGAAQGEFRPDVNTDFFYTATMLMLRGCFVSSSTAALMEDLHLDRRESLIAWRENCIELALSAIRLNPMARRSGPTVVSFPAKRAG